MRIGEIDLDAGSFGEDFVAVHLAALVISHGLAHRRRFAVEHRREAVDDGLRGRVVHLGKHHKTGRAFDQRANRGAVAGALDQVAFPVARDEAVLDLWWADMDALHVLDLVAPIIAATARLAHLVVMTQTCDQFALELAAGVQVDGVVDGLVGHSFFRIVGPKDLQFERYLLR